MAKDCFTYCSHGGVCELSAGHEGLHDSGYCQWSDNDAISRAEADARLTATGPEGALIATLWNFTVPDEDR
jgi:hypothetical protein